MNHLTPCENSLMGFGPVQIFDLAQMAHHENVNASITINLPTTIYQTEEYIKFNFYDLQGNIGGYLGLFLGVSLLQVGDILDFLYDVFNKKCHRNQEA